MDLLNKKKEWKKRQKKYEQRRMDGKIYSHIHLRELSAKWDCFIMELDFQWIWIKKYVIDFGDKIMSNIHAVNLKVFHLEIWLQCAALIIQFSLSHSTTAALVS